MLLSIIVVNWNTRELLDRCLQAIVCAAPALEHEVIVVDNGSTDGSTTLVESHHPSVRLIRNASNAGFAAANNQALRACAGEFALLLNSDARLLPGAVEAMMELFRARPRAGLCGCRLVDEQGRTQPSASGLPGLGMQAASFLGLKSLVPRRLARTLARTPAVGRVLARLSAGYFLPLSGRSEPERVAFLSGACLMARRRLWEEIGLLDENIFLYLEDADWCRRAADAGWELYFVPTAEVVHLGGQSFSIRSGGRTHHLSAERCESLLYYFRKHGSVATVRTLKLLLVVSIGGRWLAAYASVVLRRDQRSRNERARLSTMLRSVLNG